jgi:hypothetical protein
MLRALLAVGKAIWAGRSMTKRVRLNPDDPNDKSSKVIRINEPHADGRASLTQGQIASWPHSAGGIDFGALGEALPKPLD